MGGRIQKLEKWTDQADAKDLYDMLLFSVDTIHSSHSADENCFHIICELIKEELRKNIKLRYIPASSQVGRKSTVQGQN